jgi:hypothetical protein
MVKLICTTPDSEDRSMVFQIPYINPAFKQLVSSLWCQNIISATIMSHRYFLRAAFALVWQEGVRFASCPSIGIASENLGVQRVHYCHINCQCHDQTFFNFAFGYCNFFLAHTIRQ